MPTIVEQLMAAMLAALTDATAAQDRVFRSREEAIERGETPCIAMVPHVEDSVVFAKGVDDNRLEVQVEVFVRGNPFDQLADPVLRDAHKALTSSAAVAGIVTAIRRKSRTWQGAEADATAGVVATIYEVRYLSSATDLTALV